MVHSELTPAKRFTEVENTLNPEKKLWVSPDLVLTEDLFIPSARNDRPGESTVRLHLPREAVAFLRQIPHEQILSLRGSPRSRVGQVFSEFEDLSEDIDQFALENGIESFEENSSGLVIPTRFVNYGAQPKLFKKGGGIGRLYLPGGKQLTGNELVESAVRINDEPIANPNLRFTNQGVPIAIRLTLNPETRKWIPPSKRPISLDLMSSQNREQIQDVLTQVPITDRIIPYLVYSQEKLTMPDGLYGLVASYAVAGLNGKDTLRSMSVHGSSQLLDPGRDWPIIFELRGRTTQEEAANYIDIYLFSTK